MNTNDHDTFFLNDTHPRPVTLASIGLIQNQTEKRAALEAFIIEEENFLNDPHNSLKRPPLLRSAALDAARRMLDALNNPVPPITSRPTFSASRG